MLVDVSQDADQAGEHHDNANQSRDSDEAEPAFEFVQEAHRCEHGKGSAACFNWRGI
jgi:hypothetical protein